MINELKNYFSNEYVILTLSQSLIVFLFGYGIYKYHQWDIQKDRKKHNKA
jgi:hypothetical protein